MCAEGLGDGGRHYHNQFVRCLALIVVSLRESRYDDGDAGVDGDWELLFAVLSVLLKVCTQSLVVVLIAVTQKMFSAHQNESKLFGLPDRQGWLFRCSKKSTCTSSVVF